MEPITDHPGLGPLIRKKLGKGKKAAKQKVHVEVTVKTGDSDETV